MNKSFLLFYKLEWERWKRALLLQLAVLCFYPALILAIYLIRPLVLHNMAFSLLSLPTEVYAFLGIPPGTYGGHFAFFIFYAMLVLNIWLALKKCTQAVKTLRWDEKTGSIYLWLNQLAGRKQFILLKYLGTLASFWATYICWHIFLLLTILIGANQFQRPSNTSTLFRLFFLGGFLITMLMTISYFYAVIKENDYGNPDASFGKYLVFSTLIAGNLYKLRDLGIWLIELFNERTTLHFDPAGLTENFGWLDRLYWLSPLSWLNPYALQNGRPLAWQYWACVFLIAASGFFMVFVYRKRKL